MEGEAGEISWSYYLGRTVENFPKCPDLKKLTPYFDVLNTLVKSDFENHDPFFGIIDLGFRRMNMSDFDYIRRMSPSIYLGCIRRSEPCICGVSWMCIIV